MFAAIGTLVIVALLSMTVTRIAAGALIATGLPDEVARFQARSAFTGVGFTTDESTLIVRHPQRRKVVFQLMILGNLGTAAVLASLVVGLVAPGPLEGNIRFLVVLGGLFVAFVALRLSPVDRWFTWIGIKAGPRWAGHQLIGAPVEVAELDLGHVVSEVTIAEDETDRSERRRLDLEAGSALILGVREKDGSYRDVWEVSGSATYAPGDTVFVYAPRSALERLAPPEERVRPGARSG